LGFPKRAHPCSPWVRMHDSPLTGAQKVALRGQGQLMAAALKVGKGGLTPAFFAELQRVLNAHELVKLRFLGADRDERVAWCAKIADEGKCACVGAVGHTALFYRQRPEPAGQPAKPPRSAA
jgi:RNA-binding protein